MTGDLADESPLLVEIHALEVGLIIGEDLVGLGDDPNLRGMSKKKKFLLNPGCNPHASELSSSIAGRGRYWTGFRLNSTCSRSAS